jgi:hypothetical protein
MVLGNGITLHVKVRGSAEAITLETGHFERAGSHDIQIYNECGEPVDVGGQIENWTVTGPDGTVVVMDVVL